MGGVDRSPGEAEPDGPYSWVVLAAGTIGMVFTFGTPFSYGIFLGPFSETFGVPPVLVSMIFSVHLFAFFVGSGLVGILVTRFPVRRVLVAAGLVTALVAPSLFVLDSYVALLVVLGLLGVSVGTVYVVLASVVPQWFRHRRGTATGVLITGVGISLFVLPPAWRLAFDRLGVHDGFFLLILVHAVAFLVAAAVCKRPPWTERPSVSWEGLGSWARSLFSTRTFHLVALGVGLSFAWYNLLAAYAVALFTSRGFSATGASVAFGLIGGVSIASRLGSGVVADRIGYRQAYQYFLACAVLGSGFLLVPTVPGSALAVFAYGVALGGIGTLYIPVLMQTFGTQNDTAVVGIFNAVIGVFAIAAPPVGTGLVAYTGSYVSVILVTLGAALGALVAINRAGQ